MAQLNPNIILSGKVASDVPGSFQRGLRFADEARQFQENRETAPLRKKAAQQAVDIGNLKIGAAERERELFEARRGLVIAQRADTPEKWDNAAGKLGLDELVGQFARREEMIANFEMMIEALDPSTPDKPRFFPGQRGAVNQIIPDGQGGFTFKNIVPEGEASSGIKISIGGESFDFGGDQGAVEGAAVPPVAAAPDGDISRGLGLGGAVRGAIGKALDFVGFGVFFKDTAKAISDLTFLKTEFLFATRNMINQRMSNQMLDLVDKLTVSPGAIGKEGAVLRLKNGLQLIESNVEGLQRVSDNELGRFSKTDISEATADGILLANLVKQYKGIIKSLEGMEAAPEEVFDLQNEQPFGDEINDLIRKYTDG